MGCALEEDLESEGTEVGEVVDIGAVVVGQTGAVVKVEQSVVVEGQIVAVVEVG